MSEFPDEDAFAPTSEGDWRRLAEKALAGASFDTLVSTSEDSVRYGPLHARYSPVRPVLRNEPGTPWRIVQRIDDPDPARANAQALADLEGGANALSLVFEGAPTAHGFGLPLSKDAVRTALDGVMLDLVHIRIEPHPDMHEAVMALREAVVGRREIRFERLNVDHGLDPVGCFAATGRFACDRESDLRYEIEGYRSRMVGEGVDGRIFEADGRVYHDAGASEAQELGAVLATALFYFRSIADSGHDLMACVHPIAFTLAADQRQFPTMAKFRALRLLWARLLLACDGDERHHSIRIHAETSFRMMAAKDPHTNILRTTVAAFAAAAGGADSLSVLPFTVANGLPEAKARRLARNVQTILQDESGLARVADPGAGSGGIEALTEGLAKAAWDEFRRIEAEGGIVASLSGGLLQGRVAAMRKARAKAIEAGGEAIVGVTHYPLETERAVAVLIPRDEAGTVAGDEPLALRPSRLSQDREQAA